MNKMSTDKTKVQWFIDRISKRIYRNKTTCKCGVCAHVYTDGLVVDDELHANYLYDCVGISNHEGFPLQYFDTIEQRDEFERDMAVHESNL